MGSIKSFREPLSLEGCRELADALVEAPETAIPIHHLRRGLCEAYVADGLPSYTAAVVRRNNAPEHPFGLGTDHEALWELLQPIEG